MAKNPNDTFGGKIKFLRKRSGYSIKRLSSKLNVNYSYLSKIENGKSVPSEEFITKISEIFNCDKEELLLRAGKIPDDILEILKDNPIEAAEYLRNRFAS